MKGAFSNEVANGRNSAGLTNENLIFPLRTPEFKFPFVSSMLV